MKSVVGMVVLLCCVVSLVSGATLDVDRIDDEPTATACTTAPDDCSLRGAVIAANAAAGSDTIVLSAATYDLTVAGENEDLSATGDLDITDDLIIQGAGSDLSIIDGGDLDRVLHVPAFYITLEITDLTIRNGRAESNGGGGGLRGDHMTLTMTNVIVKENEAHNDPYVASGGGLHIRQGSAALTNCTFCDNYAEEGGGGGIKAYYLTNFTVEQSTFCRNDGSGIFFEGSYGPAIITDTIFDANIATTSYSGGGLIAGGGATATITRCDFIHNRAMWGAAIAVRNSNSVDLIDSTIDTNGGTDGEPNTPYNTHRGGGIYVYGGILTITGSTISANEAYSGGGIYMTNGSPAITVLNSTISGNSAETSGGGVFVEVGDATFNNTTVTGNRATAVEGYNGDGGGIYNQGGAVTVRNTILAGNMDPPDAWNTVSADDCGGAGGIVSDGYNILGNDTGCTFTGGAGDQIGTEVAPLDPLLGALVANGGPTLTHALEVVSPALDAANPAVPGSGGSACESTDQRGVPRPADGDPVPGAICDIGAYEALTTLADLSVTKDDAIDPVHVGDTISYTVTVTNGGPDEAAGVVLTDDLPTTVTFVSATPTTGSCVGSPAAHQVSCDLGVIASGGSVDVAIDVTAPATPQPVVNTVAVGALTPDANTADNQDAEGTSVAVLTGPDLKLVNVDDADPVVVGDHITYTIFLTNDGNLAASDVELIDDLALSTSYISSSSDPIGVYLPAEHRVSFDIGAVPVGATEIATVTVATPLSSRVIHSQAAATSVELDMDPADNTAGESTAVQVSNPVPSTVVLPGTGQVECFDSVGDPIACNGTGQDAEFGSGVAWPSPRFSANGDGTMTDNLTGLMWLADANCVFTNYPEFDNDIGYFDPPGTLADGRLFWSSALYFVSQVNAGVYPNCASGYNDWRMPNTVELHSMVHPLEEVQADWLTAQGFTNLEPMAYWTSTTKLNFSNPVETNLAYYVSMIVGQITSAQKWGIQPSTFPVLQVRGGNGPAAPWRSGQTESYNPGDDGDVEAGAEWPSPRFTDNGDGTISDNLTGLVWLEDADSPTTAGVGLRTWEEALAFVDELNAGSHPGVVLGGNTDWRLPNLREIMSLMDFSGHPIRLPAGHPFANVSADRLWYWSSTPGSTNYHSWCVILNYGNVTQYLRTQGMNVWPVRAGHFISTISDDDGDGIPDQDEMGPNGDDPTFDGNGDGVPDIVQDNVASTATSAGGGYVTVASGAGTTLGAVEATPSPSPGDQPAGAFPFGFFDFTVGSVASGGCTTVTLFLPLDPTITSYYKYGPEPGNVVDHWYEFPYDGTTGAEIFHEAGRTRIVLHLCDGLRGDDDLIANGIIDDIGGPITVDGVLFFDGFDTGDTCIWSSATSGCP